MAGRRFEYNENDKRKQLLLKRCLKHLKDLFLGKKDFRPRSLDELMEETYNKDVYPTIKEWLGKVGLRGLDRVEVTEDGMFVYKPPLPCRDAASLWTLLKEYKKDCSGMLRQDVLDSILGKGKGEEAISSLCNKLSFIGSNRQVLIVKDLPDPLMPEVSPIWSKLWHSVDLSQMDNVHIEAQLVNDGVTVEKKKYKPPGKSSMRPRQVKHDGQGAPVPHIKCNSHVVQDLKDYTDGGGKVECNDDGGPTASKKPRRIGPSGK